MRLLYREGWRGVRVSRARAKEMKSPVYASLHVFSKNFRAKLDFLLWNNYYFHSAGDCHNRNRLISVVFKLCKRIISPINITSFYITAPDKIHEYYSVFWLRLESAKAPNYPFFRDLKGLWYSLGASPHLSCKRGQNKIRSYMDRRVTPPRRVNSPTWGPPPPCKQASSMTRYFIHILTFTFTYFVKRDPIIDEIYQ